jgi:hypothetical protein
MPSKKPTTRKPGASRTAASKKACARKQPPRSKPDGSRHVPSKELCPEHSAAEVVELILAGWEHDEQVLDALEATGYKFGPDEGIVMGLGDECPGEPYLRRRRPTCDPPSGALVIQGASERRVASAP